MKFLFLHGWTSVPGGKKPTFLKEHGHEVINPALPDDDFPKSVRIAEAEYEKHHPDVIVGSSRGGAVAVNMDSKDTPLVLLCPAWRNRGTTTTVKPQTIILHSRQDDVIPFADSEELVANSGLPPESLIEVGIDHRLADPEPLQAMLGACQRLAGTDLTILPQSDRLIFRAWQDGDLESFHAINSDPQVMRYVGDGQVWQIGRTQQFIESASEMLDRSGVCQWALVDRTSDCLIGFCGLVDGADVPEIGWRLARDYWGRGFATEAANAILNHAKDVLGISRVMATVQTENAASVRVIEKLGMTLDRTVQRNGRQVSVCSCGLTVSQG